MSDAMLYTPHGCVLYLDLRKVYGDKVYDYSGHGNHGVIHGAKLNQELPCRGLEFDGEDDYVEVPHSDVLSITGDVTVEAVIYPHEAPPTWQEVVAKRIDTSGAEYGINYDKGYFQWFFADGAGFRIQRVTPSLPPCVWTHLACVRQSGVMKTYYNAVLMAETDLSAYTPAATTRPVYIAAKEPGVEHAKATILLVRIYNRALSSDEVKRCYEDIKLRILRRIVAARDVSAR